jgi:23S rRNA (adenine-N6)-dimethyltransferase
VHFLATPRIATQLVQSCLIDPADLVVEIGAGQGAVTTLLAETGARILAMERDPEFAQKLRNRFGERTNVRVVRADARTFPLPHKRFTVVASIPYALSTLLFQRLLSPQYTRLSQAALIVEWSFAKRITSGIPRNVEQAWWAARFDIRLVSRIPPSCFSPPPRVDSAHLVFHRREIRGERALWTLLTAACRTPSVPARALLDRNPAPAPPCGRNRPRSAGWKRGAPTVGGTGPVLVHRPDAVLAAAAEAAALSFLR